MKSFNISVDGFIIYLTDGLSVTKEGSRLEYYMKLLSCVEDCDNKTKLIEKINKNRIENNLKKIENQNN